jgi:hypothetical protein
VHAAHMGDRRGAFMIFMWRSNVKKLRGIPRHRWEYNVKICRRTGLMWPGLETGGTIVWML